jgi:hypothetical protein
MSGPRAVAVLLVVVAAFFAAGGCRSPQARAPGAATERITDPERVRRIEEGALRLQPVDAWDGPRILRQRVRIDWPGGSQTFDAVLQRRPGELALVGLGPMNLVGFRLALVAAEAGSGTPERIELENHSGRELPFSAAHILADVQRVFYPWLAAGGDEASDCAVCERSGRRGDVSIWERGAPGRLAERRFALVDVPEAGEVRIRYADWQGEPAFPKRVDLQNGWFGYRLRIETLESLGSTAAPER